MTDCYRVLVTGSREWADPAMICEVLDNTMLKHGQLLIIHGDCPTGADALAEAWVTAAWPYATSDPKPADWKRLGKAAGNARNQAMVDLGADVCYAFFWYGAGNQGTADCAARAEAAGIEVRRFYGGSK